MRELHCNEIQFVSGGEGQSVQFTPDAMIAMGMLGITLSVPVIIGGAILGIPTLGLGFVGMSAGIVGTALSGAMVIMGIVKTAINYKHKVGLCRACSLSFRRDIPLRRKLFLWRDLSSVELASLFNGIKNRECLFCVTFKPEFFSLLW